MLPLGARVHIHFHRVELERAALAGLGWSITGLLGRGDEPLLFLPVAQSQVAQSFASQKLCGFCQSQIQEPQSLKCTNSALPATSPRVIRYALSAAFWRPFDHARKRLCRRDLILDYAGWTCRFLPETTRPCWLLVAGWVGAPPLSSARVARR